MLRTALQLAERGLHVFPCWARDKRPATANGCKDATVDPIAITQWWQADPHLNIGVATGKVSDIFVLDVDDGSAETALRNLEATHGILPPSVEVITGRGRHVYFKMPQTPVRNSAGKIAPGIDTRGDGGYVLVPPSLHPSGRRYHWSVDSASTLAEAPGWLLARVTAPAPNGNGHAATPATAWRDLLANGVAEGQRDCSITRITGYLIRRYIDPAIARELLQCWNLTRCTPPLPSEDIDRIVTSIAGREQKKRANG
jgi:hypothetical protein